MLVLVTALVPATPASAAPTVITFEDLSRSRTGSSWHRITTRYESQGLTFEDEVTAVDYTSDTDFTTHSGVVGVEECFGAEFSCPDPIDFRFNRGKHRVKVWAGYRQPTSGRRVYLEAFNRFGSLLGRTSAILRSTRSGEPVPVEVPLELRFDSNAIASAQVRFRTGDGTTASTYDLVVDDIEFEEGARGLTVTPSPVDFGDVVVTGGTEQRTATATATAQLTTTIKDAFVTGVDAADFAIVSNGCAGAEVPPGDSCQVEVEFDPSEVGDRSAVLEVWSDAPDTPDVVRLVGRGIAAPTVTDPTTTSRSSDSSTSSSTTTSSPPADDRTPPSSDTTVPPVGAPSLTVEPSLERPGGVVTARGAGFPAGPVELTWEPGLATTTALAADDGSFEVQVLVLPNTILGPRRLVARSGEVGAEADFLVAPDTIQPSADNVAQISRARRYLDR